MSAAERDLRTGRVTPVPRGPLYMLVCVLWQVLKELFTETYSFWATVKILFGLSVVFVLLLGAALIADVILERLKILLF